MNKLHNNSLLLLGLGGCGAALLLWLVTGAAVVQVLLGLVLVFILPGYALTETLFTHQQLSSAERIFLATSASLAIATLGTLFLYQMGWTLQMNSWLGLFIAISLMGGAGAWVLRRQGNNTALPPVRLGFSVMHIGLLALAVALTSVAFTTARSAAPAERFQGYTLLWLTPQDASTPDRFQLGVTSKELDTTQYKVQIKADDQLAQEWPLVELAPNQAWLASIEMPAEQRAQHTVEATLYRLDQPETPYRRVVLRPTP
ncbi:MAG: DUF1616 domain-containing protein [Caldilineaceae bacterium]